MLRWTGAGRAGRRDGRRGVRRSPWNEGGRARRRVLAAAAAAGLAASMLAACSGKSHETGTVRMASALGKGEGSLNLVTMPGQMENGGSDPRVDWIGPFEERTGCKVGWRVVRTPQEARDLMHNKGRRYDGVAAPPEIAGQLVTDGDVAPVNPDLVDGYRKLEPKLRTLLHGKNDKSGKDDKTYAVPFTWGFNLVMYDTQQVQTPTGWGGLFDTDQVRRYGGKVVMRDSPLTISDAALYLRSHQRSLKIRDPYSLTQKQLDAAVALLKRQRPYVAQYWSQASDAVSMFAGGQPDLKGAVTNAVLGEAWPYQVDVLTRAGRPVQGVAPSDGVSGWMTGWMIGARAEHPNCMYQWLQWTASPDVQQQVAEWNGVAPANPQACSGDRLKQAFCNAYHVGDRAFIDKVLFAHTPEKACAKGGGDGSSSTCTEYTDWVRRWNEVLAAKS
ncbi:extracellular solute-binding protein [Actinomadura rupiterrae]|uniref:extracellular solute-binding protein n=1 Tax=Actinomadura rupiterrae TaxID=559627 RepID=UPI0020A336D7|nr:extracellular solute-binding protein [Actinomadura rupiterrae]MCP2339663.1 putative spermidine/putrescine transport system substrate-binding protein [Actinomadura rupiterrae]